MVRVLGLLSNVVAATAAFPPAAVPFFVAVPVAVAVAVALAFVAAAVRFLSP